MCSPLILINNTDWNVHRITDFCISITTGNLMISTTSDSDDFVFDKTEIDPAIAIKMITEKMSAVYSNTKPMVNIDGIVIMLDHLAVMRMDDDAKGNKFLLLYIADIQNPIEINETDGYDVPLIFKEITMQLEGNENG